MNSISSVLPYLGTIGGLAAGAYEQNSADVCWARKATILPQVNDVKQLMIKTGLWMGIPATLLAWNITQVVRHDQTENSLLQKTWTAVKSKFSAKEFLYTSFLLAGALAHGQYATQLGLRPATGTPTFFEGGREFKASGHTMLALSAVPLMSQLFSNMSQHTPKISFLASATFAASEALFLYNTSAIAENHTVEEIGAGIVWTLGLSAAAELLATPAAALVQKIFG